MKKIFLMSSFTLFLAFVSLFGNNVATKIATKPTTAYALQTDSVASDALNLRCKSAYCMDANSKTTVYAQNQTQRLPIASMCKIMTLILCFDAIESGKMDYTTVIPVSEHAMSMGGSQVYLEAGGTYTADRLMESVTVCSANDACVALAEYIAGSDSLFVQKMNQRAKDLGCENTLFSNCTGLPKEPQYSCALDVALMLKELIRHEKYFEYCKIWTDEFEHPEGRTTLITNTNKLIRHYKGCDGGKTGFTNEAGFCLAATAKRGDMRIISVCIGASTSKERFSAVSELFNYSFANFSDREVIPIQPLDEKLTVNKAKKEQIEVVPERAVRYFCKNGEENTNISHSVELYDVCAPLKKGQKVGEMTVFKDGVAYDSVAILSAEDVEKASFWDYCKKVADGWAL